MDSYRNPIEVFRSLRERVLLDTKTARGASGILQSNSVSYQVALIRNREGRAVETSPPVPLSVPERGRSTGCRHSATTSVPGTAGGPSAAVSGLNTPSPSRRGGRGVRSHPYPFPPGYGSAGVGITPDRVDR